MKKSSQVLTLFVALSIIFSCVVVGFGQNRGPMVGGYKPVATDDAGVLEAAEQAVSLQGEKEGVSLRLVSVERAERQVVAGQNYRLCLKVVIDEEEDSEETQDVKVQIFRSLKNEYQLKSWEVDECSESN